MSWQIFAVISALAAGATSVLAKIGLEQVPSNLANAARLIESFLAPRVPINRIVRVQLKVRTLLVREMVGILKNEDCGEK